MKLLKYTNRLISVTIPIILPIIQRYRIKVLILIILSILLGFIPAIKSGIESNFLSESERIISSGFIEREGYSKEIDIQIDGKITLDDILSHKFRKRSEEDFFDNLPNYFTNGHVLLEVIIIYLFALIIAFLVEYYSEKIKAILNKYIFVSIREQAFKKALNSKPSDLPKIFNISGNLASSIQTGTGNITEVYDFFTDIFQFIFLLITSLLVLISKAWLFGVVFIVTIIIQVILSIFRAKKLKKNRKDLEKQRNSLVGQTEDIISKKEIILAFEQESKYTNKITELSERYGDLSKELAIKGFTYSKISILINELERFIIPLLALLFVIYFDKKAIEDIGGVFFLITLYSRLSNPVISILSQYNSLKENEAVSNSLLDLLEVHVYDSATLSKNEPQMNTAVTFDSITFSYDSKINVFEKFSLEIPINKTTLILGPSGCGKSSIAKIILGYWPINKGSIHLMGHPLLSYSDKEIRLFTSYISQGDYVIDETIRENLDWSSSGEIVSDDIMMNALYKVKLVNSPDEKNFLNRFAKDLSVGEQQRLSLVRILLDNSPLLLLDEPLTGVDVYTIRDIMPAFKDVLENKKRTVVLISHKLSFASSVEHIILLNSNGELVEQGNPKDLIKNLNSTFYKLYKTATEEFKL